jgi:hypothetical protein
MEQFMAAFKADKDAVTLEPGGSAEVTVSNGSPGPMTIAVMGSIPGIETKFDQTHVKAGERAVLTVHAGEGAKSGRLQLRIDPVGKIIPIQVSVK